MVCKMMSTVAGTVVIRWTDIEHECSRSCIILSTNTCCCREAGMTRCSSGTTANGTRSGDIRSKRTRTTHTSAKANRVQIQSPDPDNFQNLMGTSLFKDTSTIKFSFGSDQLFPRYEPNC